MRPKKSVLVLHAVVLLLHTAVLVLVLVLQIWCFVKHDLVTLVIILILKDTTTFQVLFIVSLFCAWNVTTVEINSSVHLLKVISVKCLCLLLVVFFLGLVSLVLVL